MDSAHGILLLVCADPVNENSATCSTCRSTWSRSSRGWRRACCGRGRDFQGLQAKAGRDGAVGANGDLVAKKDMRDISPSGSAPGAGDHPRERAADALHDGETRRRDPEVVDAGDRVSDKICTFRLHGEALKVGECLPYKNVKTHQDLGYESTTGARRYPDDRRRSKAAQSLHHLRFRSWLSTTASPGPGASLT